VDECFAQPLRTHLAEPRRSQGGSPDSPGEGKGKPAGIRRAAHAEIHRKRSQRAWEQSLSNTRSAAIKPADHSIGDEQSHFRRQWSLRHATGPNVPCRFWTGLDRSTWAMNHFVFVLHTASNLHSLFQLRNRANCICSLQHRSLLFAVRHMVSSAKESERLRAASAPRGPAVPCAH